jgi:hypothetical protein
MDKWTPHYIILMAIVLTVFSIVFMLMMSAMIYDRQISAGGLSLADSIISSLITILAMKLSNPKEK